MGVNTTGVVAAIVRSGATVPLSTPPPPYFPLLLVACLLPISCPLSVYFFPFSCSPSSCAPCLIGAFLPKGTRRHPDLALVTTPPPTQWGDGRVQQQWKNSLSNTGPSRQDHGAEKETGMEAGAGRREGPTQGDLKIAPRGGAGGDGTGERRRTGERRGVGGMDVCAGLYKMVSKTGWRPRQKICQKTFLRMIENSNDQRHCGIIFVGVARTTVQ